MGVFLSEDFDTVWSGKPMKKPLDVADTDLMGSIPGSAARAGKSMPSMWRAFAFPGKQGRGDGNNHIDAPTGSVAGEFGGSTAGKELWMHPMEWGGSIAGAEASAPIRIS